MRSLRLVYFLDMFYKIEVIRSLAIKTQQNQVVTNYFIFNLHDTVFHFDEMDKVGLMKKEKKKSGN